MRIVKWGKSLAVRIPREVAASLDLKERDQTEIRLASRREFEVSSDRTRERALESLRRLRRPFPDGFRFDREEANSR